MHQHSLASFGVMFGIVPPQSTLLSLEFQDAEYGSAYALVGHPRSALLRLNRLQLKHLRQHYVTYPEDFDNVRHPDLANMNNIVKLYYSCRNHISLQIIQTE